MKRTYNDSTEDEDHSNTRATSARPAPVRAETGHASMPERQRVAIGRLAVDRLKLTDVIAESRLAQLPKDIVGVVFGSYLRDIVVDPPPGQFGCSVFGTPTQTRLSSDYGCACFKKTAHHSRCGACSPWGFCDGGCDFDTALPPDDGITRRARLFASGPDLIVVKGGHASVCVIANIWTPHEVHCHYPVHEEARQHLTDCIILHQCTARRHENGAIVFYTAAHAELMTFFVNADGHLTWDPATVLNIGTVPAEDRDWTNMLGMTPGNTDFITKDHVPFSVRRKPTCLSIIEYVGARPHIGQVVCDAHVLSKHDTYRAFASPMASNLCVMVYEQEMADHVCGTKFLWFSKDATTGFALTGYAEYGRAIDADGASIVVDQAGRLCVITTEQELTAICPGAVPPELQSDN